MGACNGKISNKTHEVVVTTGEKKGSGIHNVNVSSCSMYIVLRYCLSIAVKSGTVPVFLHSLMSYTGETLWQSNGIPTCREV